MGRTSTERERDEPPPAQTTPSSGSVIAPGQITTAGGLAPWIAWQRIGQQALRLEPRTELKTLREISKECQDLVIIATWQAYGERISQTAEALRTGRSRVRRAIHAWREAQAEMKRRGPSKEAGSPR